LTTGNALTKPITEAARKAFSGDQVEAIRRTVAKDCNDAELVMFLELCGRYGLDPWTGQIYAVRMSGRDGGRGGVVIMTSRDGLLAIANRHEDFAGMLSDVVRENDDFKKTSEDVQHEYEGSTEKRGKIVGAWALVYRKDRKASYFFAPMEEYNSNKATWKQYPSAMIVKVAESMALRRAYSISGLVAEEEMDATSSPTGMRSEAPAIDWGEDPAMALWLQQLVDTARKVAPAKAPTDNYLRLQLNGPIRPEKRRAIADGLVDLISEEGGEVPELIEQPTVILDALPGEVVHASSD
jgi:phage recombination protein Bet